MFLMLFCFTTNIFSQKINVKETRENIAESNNNVLTVLIYGASEKNVVKSWKALMKNYKAKTSSSKGEIFADNVNIISLSSSAIDVYAKTKDKNGAIELIAGFDLGDGVFISSADNPAKYKIAEGIIYNFALNVTRDAISEEQKKSEKEHVKLENKLKQIVRDNKRLNINVEKYEGLIEQAKEDIKMNLKDQEDFKNNIKTHQKELDEIKEKLKNVE